MKRAVVDHIEKIRRANENIKRWWVIGATTIVMCVIAILWIIYISATLPQTNLVSGNFAGNPNIPQTEKTEVNSSFFGTVIKGVKLTSYDIWNSLNRVKHTFISGTQNAINYTIKKKEIIIQKEPTEKPFIPNDSEPLEPTPLPSY